MTQEALRTILNFLPIYAIPGLFCMLMLIRLWRVENESITGFPGLESAMTRIALLSLLAWPYVLVVSVLAWPVFSWQFWVRPIRFPAIRVNHWWVR
jgi:hypothetical protein